MSHFLRWFRFEILLRILIILLPFTTVLSVFTKEKLFIPGVTYYKELLIILLGIWLFILHREKKVKFQITGFDILILLYILYLVGVTFFTTGISGMLYGGRYDFEFLILFLIALHGSKFLEEKLYFYFKIFLISGGIALFLSILVRFVFTEDSLLLLGFSGNPSAWQFGGSVPIFHGVDGANVRRFQGIFDGPNTMGAFLLLYIGSLAYYFRSKKDWYFIIGIIIFGFIGLMTLTQSRSAMVGLVISILAVSLFSLRTLWKYYRWQMLTLGICFLLLMGAFLVKYASSSTVLLERSGSSKGHFERMMTWVERFESAPFGQWLGSSGPAYRYVLDLGGRSREDVETLDRYYIPESWYVQQLVEWGIFGAGVFAFLFLFLLISLYRSSPIWFATFLSLCIMNFFLHTFESSTISLLLFLFTGLTLGTHHFRDFLNPYAPKK